MVAWETPQSRCRILDSMRGCDSHPPPWETSGRCEKSTARWTSSSMPRYIGWSVVRRPPPRDGSWRRWSRIISTPRSAAAPTVSEFIESIARLARVAALAASASLPKRCSRTSPRISSRDPPPKRAPCVAKSSKRSSIAEGDDPPDAVRANHDHREGEAEDDDGADEATALIAPASALCHQGRVTLVYPAG